MFAFNKAVHHIPRTYGMDSFLDAIGHRLDRIARKVKVNEFSGKNINSIKSIILQIAQSDTLTLTNKKIICIDILVAVEEFNR